MIKNEKVMVVKKSLLIAAGFADEPGFFSGSAEKIINAIDKNFFFMERGVCETDYAHKQIIPYTVVRHGNKYLLLKRLNTQGEARLHGMLSIGVGGHINETDATDESGLILSGALRELNEEVSVPYTDGPKFMGVLNDSGTDVGSVHLGLVYLLDAGGERFTINERDKMEGRWADVGELNGKKGFMEGWSRILMESGLIC